MTDSAAAPGHLHVELVGGDELGRHVVPALSWWLPDGASTQSSYRIVTDDGYDSGLVVSDRQTYVEVPVFDRARRLTSARVQVQTDLGESAWSEPVVLESGLLDPADWSADWIGVFEAERPEKALRPAYWLRSEFEVTVLGGARLYVTAFGLYEVFLNGERVGDVELAPGYTQYAKRVPYQAFDVAALLRPGRNVLAVLVADGWYRGQVGAPRPADQFGTDVAVRLQLEVRDGETWTTLARSDGSWRTSPSYITAADLIGGQHEDRRLVDSTVHAPGFDDASWAPATAPTFETPIVRPMSPPVRRVEEITAVSVTRLATDGALIADLGQNINGWTRLADLGPAGSHLTLRHGEHLDADGDLTTEHLTINLPFLPAPLPVGQVDEVVSAGVEGDVFEPRFTTHGFQYVRIEGHPGPLAPEDVTGVVVHSDLRRTGWFECSDERINRLHEAVVWSLRGNMCAIPTDCPQRERSGWTGDWQIFAPTAAYLFDVNGFTRSWLRDVALDRRADGCVGNISPATPTEGFDGGLMARLNGSAGWGDVVASAPSDLYRAYGDETLLRESWAAMTGWVDYAARTAAENRHPSRVAARPEPLAHEEFLWDTGFHWGEWLEPGLDLSDFGAFAGADKSIVATAYLHRSALTVAEVAEVLGEDESTVARYRAIADGAKAAWTAEFVQSDGTLAVQTQAAHVRALAFGLVPDDLRAGIADRLVELVAEADGHLSTGFLSTGLLLPTLAEVGKADTAYELLFQDSEPSWLVMLDRGATTVWEWWNGINAEGVAHESLNHYSKGAVVSFLHQYVAGLTATSPGYRTFRVKPVPGGGLTSASASLDSPYGRIVSSWQLDADGFHLQVLVPGGTTAEVVLPDGTTDQVGPGQHAWNGPSA